MPTINYGSAAVWDNYHRTRPLTVNRPAWYFGDDVGQQDGVVRFAKTRGALHSYVEAAMQAGVPAHAFGRAWSYADLTGMADLQLDLTGLRGCSQAVASELHSDCQIAVGELAIVSGGTTLREIVNWAKPLGLSLATSGSHLGQTIGGVIAPGSHGSMLGVGGTQNHIVGLHLVTGRQRSVWIERQTQPVLSDASAASFATSVVRNDDMFEDALIHLGALGLVNGVVMQMVPYRRFQLLAVRQPAWPGWLEQMATGNFGAILQALSPGEARTPLFYETTIDPIAWDQHRALHLIYLPATGPVPAEPRGEPATTHPAIIRPGESLSAMALFPQQHALLSVGLERGAFALRGDQVVEDFPLLDFYADNYFPVSPPKKGPWPELGWEDLHGDVVTGGNPGAIYNAALAVPRETIAQVIPLICATIQPLPKCMVMTLRFVSGAMGSLAFTRWPETVVIDLEGASDRSPNGLHVYAPFTRKAVALIRQALDEAGLIYSLHWAKLGGLDAAKVEQDYGPAQDARSPLSRWRATRTALLSNEGDSLFRNKAVIDYGLF